MSAAAAVARPKHAPAESRDILLSAIKPPKGFNLRDEVDVDGPEIAALGENIRLVGLIAPLIVRENGSSESFELVAGFRRYAAMKAAGLRGQVPCRVWHFDSAADAVLMNITENTERKTVHSADLACRLYQLENGTYPGADLAEDGTGLQPVERSVVCERTGLSSSYVGNLIRAWKNLTEKIRKAWRRQDIPTDAIIAWGKLKTEEEQVAAYEAWDEARRAAAARGEKKTPRRGGGDEEDGEAAAPKRKKQISELLEKFSTRREDEKLSARDLDVVDAKIATLRWVLGKTKRLTFL